MYNEWIMPVFEGYLEEYARKPVIEDKTEVKAEDIQPEEITDAEVLDIIGQIQTIFDEVPNVTADSNIRISDKALTMWENQGPLNVQTLVEHKYLTVAEDAKTNEKLPIVKNFHI